MTSLPDDYETRLGLEKQQILWNNICKTRYPDTDLPLQSQFNFYWSALRRGLFSPRYLKQTCIHVSDELPEGRTKLIHRYGATSLVTFEPQAGHPFTGLLASGGCGIFRASLLLPARSFSPGFALKLLVDRNPSANFVMIPTLGGQNDNMNVFLNSGSNCVSTQVHSLIFKLLIFALRITVKQIGSEDLEANLLPLDRISSIRSDGSRETTPVVPARLIFLPTPASQMSSLSTIDYRLRLREIPAGTILYHVLAEENAESRPIKIGDLRTTSEFIASAYGDDTLFFNHDPGKIIK